MVHDSLYSAAYVILDTDTPGLAGHGLTFTIGGVNEVLAVLLMAARHGLLVCPHAGGVDICEYVAVSGSREGRVIEYVDHLHEHFEEPCTIREAAYMPPTAPGSSIAMKAATLDADRFRG